MKKSNRWYGGLLRVCRERPKGSRSSTNHFNEIASSHCLPLGSGLRQRWDYSRVLLPAEWGPTVIFLRQQSSGPNFRFGSLADNPRARVDVCSTPEADIGVTHRQVSFGPLPDLRAAPKNTRTRRCSSHHSIRIGSRGASFRSSFAEAALFIVGFWFDPDATPMQCLTQKHFDL